MKFNHAHCKLCGADKFSEHEVMAYDMTIHGLRKRDLEGRQPGCGVLIVCLDCCTEIHDSLLGT